MKERFKKIVGWFKESNRFKHLKAGLVIFALVFLSSLLLEKACDCRILIDSVLSFASVAVGMFSVEYIQRESGGKWDWSDVLAGCLIPLALVLVVLISSVL